LAVILESAFVVDVQAPVPVQPDADPVPFDQPAKTEPGSG